MPNAMKQKLGIPAQSTKSEQASVEDLTLKLDLLMGQIVDLKDKLENSNPASSTITSIEDKVQKFLEDDLPGMVVEQIKTEVAGKQRVIPKMKQEIAREVQRQIEEEVTKTQTTIREQVQMVIAEEFEKKFQSTVEGAINNKFNSMLSNMQYQ